MKKAFLILAAIILVSCDHSVKTVEVEKPIDSVAAAKISNELDSLIEISNFEYDEFGRLVKMSGPNKEVWKELSERAYSTNDSILFKKAIDYYVDVEIFEMNPPKQNVSESQKSQQLKKPSEWEVKPGYTREFVLSAWGKPDHIATSETSSYKCEMFYYYKRNTIVTIFDGWVEEVSTYK